MAHKGRLPKATDFIAVCHVTSFIYSHTTMDQEIDKEKIKKTARFHELQVRYWDSGEEGVGILIAVICG